MKVVPIGLQCSVPHAIKTANLYEYAYPFDWLWTPSITTYRILKILLEEGVDKAIDYMTNGYKYYKYHGNERYSLIDEMSSCQMNRDSGLGITHYKINQDYKEKLKRRLIRLLNDITSKSELLFIYADAANPDRNYYLDDVEYGVDATESLCNIYKLITPYNNSIKVVYFCWESRIKENSTVIHMPFTYKKHWIGVADLIKDYLLAKIGVDRPCA